MTEEKKALIEALSAKATHAREHFRCIGAANTYGLNAMERVQLDSEYAVAWAGVLEAEAELREAQQP